MKIKTLILFAFTSIMMFSCGESKNTSIQTTDITIKGIVVETYVIDSCEYIGNIVNGAHNQDWMTHKGNCIFCKSRNSK